MIRIRPQPARIYVSSYTYRFASAFGPSVMMLSRLLIPAVFALLLSATGCLFHTRTVEVRLSTAKLMTATQQELVDRLNQEAARIRTLNATVDIDTEVGGEKRGKADRK